jgi:hypothetical protein
MSPELTTLDDLLGGDMPLNRVRDLFDRADAFIAGISALLRAGEIRLVNSDGKELPHWSWPEALSTPTTSSCYVTITEKGVKRIS